MTGEAPLGTDEAAPADAVLPWLVVSVLAHGAVFGLLALGWWMLPEAPPEPLFERIDPATVMLVSVVAPEVVQVPAPPEAAPPAPPAEPPKPEAPKPEPKPRPAIKVPPPTKTPPAAEAPPPTAPATAPGAAPGESAVVLPKLSTDLLSEADYALWFAEVRHRFTETFSVIDAFKGHGLITVVRITFDGTGTVTDVSLTQSSGNAAVDQSVLLSASFVSTVPLPPDRYRALLMALELSFDADDA